MKADSDAYTLLPVRVIAESSNPVTVVRPCVGQEPVQPAAKPRRAATSGLLQLDTPRGRLHIQGVADPWTLRIVLESLLG